MKKTMFSLFAILLSLSASANSLTSGSYHCNDGGTLDLKKTGLTSYRARLNYGPNSSSTLDRIEFRSTDSLVGTMYPDDDGTLGRAMIVSRGKGVELRFDEGSILSCFQ
jgi:hypothetical protein